MAEEKKKYPTPRGAAATAAKNKYRDGNYDRMELARSEERRVGKECRL